MATPTPFYLLLLFCLLTGCKQKGNQPTPPLRGDTALTRTAKENDSLRKQNPIRDSTLYVPYIPVSLTAYLKKNMPAWSIPAPSMWDEYWFDQYKKDSSLVGFLPGDFNGDNLQDYCLILIHQDLGIAVWTFLGNKETFTSVKIDQFGNPSGLIDIGIEPLPAGRHAALDDGEQSRAPVMVKNAGLTIIFFEKAARSYYWDNGKIKSIQTGD